MLETLHGRGPGRHSHIEGGPNPTVRVLAGRAPKLLEACPVIRRALAALTVVAFAPAVLLAQSPWERAASNLEATFTGPLARSLALVAIVIGGLLFMFGESGAKRQISGIVFGGGLALFATQFLAWLF
jgi:type IV secretory pathway VirB2 component (pilin)